MQKCVNPWVGAWRKHGKVCHLSKVFRRSGKGLEKIKCVEGMWSEKKKAEEARRRSSEESRANTCCIWSHTKSQFCLINE